MNDLVITRVESQDGLGAWRFHDIRKFSRLAHLKNETWYHYSRLREMQSIVYTWRMVHPDRKVFVEYDGVRLPLMSDADWAIAILRFSE